MQILIGVLIGLVLGALATWLVLRTAYAVRAASVSTERNLLRERVVDLEAAVGDDRQTASVLAPLGAALQRVERQVAVLERDRVEQFGELGARLQEVGRSTAVLQHETSQLAGALRSSSARGTWGEMQLRRILEHSGMLPHCDFDEQVTAISRHQATVRPDVVVRLPGAKVLVIDSKAPLSKFLAAQADDLRPQDQTALLAEHASALVRHIDALGGKDYWSAFEQSPQLVVCFLPADAILGSALRSDPSLLDRAMSRNVVLASPSTLLALLRSTTFAWQQDNLNSGARELLDLGRTLYERLATLGKHTTALGASLRKSVESYNLMVGTLENRVLVTSRKMHELGMATDAPPVLTPVDAAPRPLTAAELLEALDEDVARPQLDLRVDRPHAADRRGGTGTA
ncbi:DNA recombination protein RmuC [Leekyejoonella antrihumi]|uniref:DNA recombination protein RmuC n=2 Tax=Leekyejoonella antrihumi TaxID=1660198 RepID=A0A563E4M6_9MICO|nr:DNA recombination protein RmuC [Leekyejoonella antrihumi]